MRSKIGRRPQIVIFGALTVLLIALTVLNAILGAPVLALLAGVIAVNCAVRTVGAIRGRRFGLTVGPRRRPARPTAKDPTAAAAQRDRAQRLLQDREPGPDARARERREARRRRRLDD